MVPDHYLVVSSFVVIAVIDCVRARTRLWCFKAEVVNLRVIKYLALLIVAEKRSKETKCSRSCYRQFKSLKDLQQVS
jgi:hypothetical protein